MFYQTNRCSHWLGEKTYMMYATGPKICTCMELDLEITFAMFLQFLQVEPNLKCVALRGPHFLYYK